MGHINKSSKTQKYGFLSFVMGARIFKSNSSVRQGAQIFRPIDFGLLTSQIKKAFARHNGLVALQLLAVLAGGFLSLLSFSNSAYAASYVNVSSGGSGDTAGVVSLGKIKPSSSGSTATGNDTLTVHTDCSAGYKVYVSGQNGKTTNLTNQSATDPTNPSSSDIISASSNTIASPNTLSSNTWGISGNSTDIENHLYAGLPAYSSATGASLVTKSDVAEESTVPIYYGVKADTTLNPGTYSGDILYTVLMDTSCIPYTVEFSPNVEQSSESEITGEMTAQSILPNSATALTANAYEREGYTFLGWSTTPEGKTGNVTNGIGTVDDVDYNNEAEVTNLTTSGSSITLYAIWEVAVIEDMQNWLGCGKMSEGDTVRLKDVRDNTIYKVKKIGGDCWMIENLILGHDKGYALTSELTNIPSSDTSTYYFPMAGRRGYLSSASTIESSNTATPTFDSNYDNQAQVQYRAQGQGGDQSSSGTLSQSTGYYNFWAASLGYSGYIQGSSSGNTPRDICPKGWQLPLGGSNTTKSWVSLDKALNGSSAGSDRNDSTARNRFLNDAGFLYSGYYESSQLHDVGSYGLWWSSTVNSTVDSYRLYLNSSGYVGPQNSTSKHLGYAVRCVAQYSNVTGTMQNFDNSTLTNIGDTTSLVDSRDNKVYAVKKLPDGKVWMMQNLTIGMDGAKTLTPADTNIDNGITYYLPPAGKQGSSTIDNSSTLTATDTANFASDSSTDAHAKTQFRTKNTSYTNDSDTGYYNFYTATLGYSYYGANPTSGTSTRDICPKGWRLPRTTDNGTTVSTTGTANDFTNLVRQYSTSNWSGTATSNGYYTTNSTAKNSMYLSTAYPLATSTANNYAGFSYVGYWDGTRSSALNVGSDGYYWSASVYDNTYYGYFLDFRPSGVYPQNLNSKYYGFAVRCVAQNNATITFDANGGTGEMSPQRVYENSNLQVNTFTRDGYAFIGWSEDANATTATYADGASVSDLVSRGGNITLYAVWQKIDGDMQNFICRDSYITSGQTKTLRDARDGQLYTIYRIPTDNAATNVAGKCIMTKDLNLGAVNSVSGSSSTITANGTMTLSPEDSTFTTPSGSGESITVPTSTVSVTHGTPGSGNNEYANRQYRIDSTGNYAGRGYYTWGTAMIACPKGWRLPTSDELNNNDSWNSSITGISKAVNNNISTIQSSPWSFVLGGYYYNGFSNAGSLGYYWSSTQGDSTYSYTLYLSSSDGLLRGVINKRYGFAVRCMADDYDNTMQDFDSSTLTNVGDTAKLLDTRDNKVYTVKKLPDGKVWMMQNLTIGSDGAKTLTKDDTNINNNTTYYLPPAGKQGSSTIDNSSTLTATDTANFGGTDNRAKTQFRTKNTSYTNDSDTGYYNFYTVTLGFSYYGDSVSSGTSTRDICPKGWRLPKTTDSGTNVTTVGSANDFTYLALQYNSSTGWSGSATGTSGWGYYNNNNAVNNPMYLQAAYPLATSTANNYAGFSYAGYWSGTNSSASDVGSYGRYWSASVYNTYSGYYLNFGSSYVYPQRDNNKSNGLAVRCVAKSTDAVCFTAGTQIQTTMDGDTKSIEDIKVGDEVVSYDPNTQEYYMTEVAGTIVHDGDERTTKLVKLTLDNGATLEMTQVHPILTTNGYKAVENEEYGTLTEDDVAITTTGEHDIVSIDIYDVEPTTVYNLTVKGRDGDAADGPTHSYIANGVVVHNGVSCGAGT